MSRFERITSFFRQEPPRHLATPEKVGVRQRTPQFVNVAKELLALPTRTKRMDLMNYQLHALLKEWLGVPFHHTTYDIRDDKNARQGAGLYLFDPIYAQTDVLEWCRKAVAAANAAEHSGDKTQAKFAERYTLEMSQTKAYLQLLCTLLPPHGVLEAVCHSQPDTQLTQIEASFLPPEVRHHCQLSPNESVLAGPKFFSIMSQSAVHGAKSIMYVIDQPVYLLEQKRWITAHSQHMVLMSPNRSEQAYWDDQHHALQRFMPDYIPPAPDAPREIHEHQIMSHVTPLPSEWTTVSAENAFTDILYTKKHDLQRLGAQQATYSDYLRLAPSIPLHSHYILDILDIDQAFSPTWSDQKAERLYQAMLNSISTLLQRQQVTPELTASWLQLYQKQYQNQISRQDPWQQRDAFRIKSAQGASWVLNSLLSNIECLVLNEKMIPLESIMKNLATGPLNASQLQQAIGASRAAEWIKHGKRKCRGCPDKTYTGECGFCKRCEDRLSRSSESEFSSDANSATDSSKLHKRQGSQMHTRHHTGEVKPRPLSVTQWLTGDYKRDWAS